MNLREITLAENEFIWEGNSFPGHDGRPGQRGGSLPRNVVSGLFMIDKMSTSDFLAKEKSFQAFKGVEREQDYIRSKFPGKPVISDTIETGENYVCRVVETKEFAEDFCNTASYMGSGASHNAYGHYFFTDYNKAVGYKQGYPERRIIEANIDTSKQIRESELYALKEKYEMRAYNAGINNTEITKDSGVFAATIGATSIKFDDGVVVVLDRSALKVLKDSVDYVNIDKATNSFPGHKGIPGHRGGSLPRSASGMSSLSDKDIIGLAWRSEADSETDPKSRKFAMAVAKKLGFTGTPKQLSHEEFEKLDDKDYEVFSRGLRDTEDMSASKMHKEFMEGAYYVSGAGYDTIGKGIYMTDDRNYAKSYAEAEKLMGVKGSVETIAIPRKAKILDLRTAEGITAASKAWDEVREINKKIDEEYKLDIWKPSDKNTKNPYTLNVWEYIETKGYDGIRNEAELCLFNRTIAVVDKDLENI